MTDDEKRVAMCALSDDERVRLIDEAHNVVGFGLFQQRSKQVQLRDGYRKPQQPGPGGQA